MGESQLPASKPELYERLIDRLGLALEVARTSVRLRDEMPAELELRGLSHAEFEVIKAYLESLPAGRHAAGGSTRNGTGIGQDHLAQGQKRPASKIQDAAIDSRSGRRRRLTRRFFTSHSDRRRHTL
jgi:hypothetical protein